MFQCNKFKIKVPHIIQYNKIMSLTLKIYFAEDNEKWGSKTVLKVSSSIFGRGWKKSGPLLIPRKLPTSKPSSSETIEMAPKPATARSSKKSADNKSEKSCKDCSSSGC